MTLDEAKQEAKQIVAYAKGTAFEVAMEVAINSKKEYVVQPFGIHALFKSHKLVHVEPIPQE